MSVYVQNFSVSALSSL